MFDWSTKEKIVNACFRPTYHLTMGKKNPSIYRCRITNLPPALQTCTLTEFIDIDKTYRERILLRRQIIKDEFANVIEANPVGTPAVHELYSWIFNIYLPKRYPTMFAFSRKGYLLNKVFNEFIPLTPPIDPRECLQILGSHIDNDFLILLPEPDPNATLTRIIPTPTPPHPYHMHAYVLCFPSGFSTPKKFGIPLAAVHTPVPGYAAKLEKSMDRFFSMLVPGKIVRRTNWAVQDDSVLFKVDKNHMIPTLSPGSMAPTTHEPSAAELKEWEEKGRKIKPEECVLRSERQTLHRLEETGALVFAFKTLMYPLPDIKGTPMAEEMAEAVEGLWKGSVPAMAVYKRGVIWGQKVVEYLRAGQ